MQNIYCEWLFVYSSIGLTDKTASPKPEKRNKDDSVSLRWKARGGVNRDINTMVELQVNKVK